MHAPTPYLNKLLQKILPFTFPVIGIACLLEPDIMTDYAPAIVGVTMVIAGSYSYIQAIRHRRYREQTNQDMPLSLLMALTGLLILVKQEQTIELMGYIWGLLGMYKGTRLLNQALYHRLHHEKARWKGLWGGFNLVLGAILILDPAESFSHHVFLLGLEFIAYSMQYFRPKALKTFLMRRGE